jgi:hypothetical protein
VGKTKFSMICVAAMVMNGCGSSDINSVKESTLTQDPSYSVTGVFDNRHICENIEWKSWSDERKRTTVQYRCSYRGAETFFKQLAATIKVNAARTSERQSSELERELKAYESRVPKDEAILAEAEKELASYQEPDRQNYQVGHGPDKSSLTNAVLTAQRFLDESRSIVADAPERREKLKKEMQEHEKYASELAYIYEQVSKAGDTFTWIISADNSIQLVGGSYNFYGSDGKRFYTRGYYPSEVDYLVSRFTRDDVSTIKQTYVIQDLVKTESAMHALAMKALQPIE